MRHLSTTLLLFLLLISSVSFAQKQNDQYQKMYDCVISNQLTELEKLLQNCKDINQITKNGHHIFESVFVMGNCDAAKLFFEKDINLSYINSDGKSIRELIKKGKNKTLKKLLKKHLQK